MINVLVRGTKGKEIYIGTHILDTRDYAKSYLSLKDHTKKTSYDFKEVSFFRSAQESMF
jgi:hypothetical protein